jgi:hypothetical protein
MPPIVLFDSELAAIMDACRPLQPRELCGMALEQFSH